MWRDKLTIIVGFGFGSAPNVTDKGHIMMIGNRNSLQALLPAGLNKLKLVGAAGRSGAGRNRQLGRPLRRVGERRRFLA
jgi:hypothetical protein